MINWTHVKPNSNGHSRIVCHFLKLLTEEEKGIDKGLDTTSYLYNLALNRSRKIGGRKFHNKQFCGGIVFTTSARTPEEVESQIMNLLDQSRAQN